MDRGMDNVWTGMGKRCGQVWPFGSWSQYALCALNPCAAFAVPQDLNPKIRRRIEGTFSVELELRRTVANLPDATTSEWATNLGSTRHAMRTVEMTLSDLEHPEIASELRAARDHLDRAIRILEWEYNLCRQKHHESRGGVRCMTCRGSGRLWAPFRICQDCRGNGGGPYR